MQAQLLFTNYIIAGVEASLARVRAAEYVIPQTDRQQAWQILSFALKVEGAWSVTRELLLALAPKMEMAGFREEWIAYLEKGINCAQKIDDVQAIAECEIQIGILYRLMSRFEEASSWTTMSVEHFAAHNNTHGQARALHELAWLAQLQHDYERAERHIADIAALSLIDEITYADIWRVKGMIAMGRRQWTEAVHSHRQALSLFQQTNDVRKIAWSMQNIGYALKELGVLDEAGDYLKQAAETLQTLQDHHHMAIVWMNLANVLVRQENPQLACEFFVAAQEIFEKQGNLLNQAHVLTNLGIAYLELGEPTVAQSMFRKASALYLSLGDLTWHINALDGSVMALIASGEYVDALQLADQALVLLPQIRNSSYYENLLEKLTEHRSEAELRVSVTV